MKLKKITAFAISLLLILTGSSFAARAVSVSSSQFTGSAVMQKRLQTLLDTYTPGASYFTSTPYGANNLGDKTHTCKRCFVGGILQNDFSTCGYFDREIQCHGYAAYAQYILFGRTFKGTTNSSVSGSGTIRYEKVMNPTKSQIMQMPLGTHIRNTISSSLSHSVILLKADANTITYLDCNCLSTWGCAVHLHAVSWPTFFSYGGIGSASISGYAAYPASETYPKDPAYKNTPFTDIGSHWARDDIARAYEKGMVTGKTRTTFVPASSITRAEYVQILYNLALRPAAGSAAYTDVSAGSWYAAAIGWAQENGIVEGLGNNRFGPNLNITREEACKILCDFLQGSHEFTEVEIDAILAPYGDAASSSSWARPYLAWAVKNQVLIGNAQNRLNPRDKATRAEMVTLLLRVF